MLPKKNNQGFTLVEVLVAIALSALVALLAYQSLSAASTAGIRVRESTESLQALDRTWLFMQQDLRHAIPRQSLTGQGTESDLPKIFEGAGSVVSGSFYFASESMFLRFTRSGWENPLLQKRSELQGVGYQLQDGTLYRFSWAERDEQDSLYERMQRRKLLEDVEDIELQFLPSAATEIEDSNWEESWPTYDSSQSSSEAALPRAIKVTLTLQEFGEIERLFLLTTGEPDELENDDGSGDETGDTDSDSTDDSDTGEDLGDEAFDESNDESFDDELDY